MKTNTKHIFKSKPLLAKSKLVLLMFMAVAAISSCKNTETEGDLVPDGLTSVNVQISDITFDAVNTVSNKASVNKSSSSLDLEVQRSTMSLNKDYDLLAELSPELPSVSNGPISSTGGNRAATVTNVMNPAVLYKIIAYDEGGKYVSEKDYVRGQENLVSDFLLDGDKTYNFIVYSINSTSVLPAVTFSDINNKTLATSSVVVNGNADFLYAQQSKKLVAGAKNQVNVILKHKFSQITTTIDATATGYSITAISSAINSHRSTASIALSDGTITRSESTGDASISFPNLGLPRVESTPTIINASVNNASFTIKSITVGSLVRSNLILFKNLVITPGVKYNMKVSLVPTDGFLTHDGQSAVRIHGNIWMRHNLGANTALNADQQPYVRGLHGNYYQWGRKPFVANGTATTVNGSWVTSGVPPNYSWNSNGEYTPAKVDENDPCPDRYRIPTRNEFEDLLANTTSERKGSWLESATNYNAAVVLTSKRKAGIIMTFPAQGFMKAQDFGGNDRPPFTLKALEARGLSVQIHTSSVFRNIMNVFNGTGVIDNESSELNVSRFSGRNIRCVAIFPK